MLANQAEMMAFSKAGWHITEINTDPATGDQTIYMGKCAAASGSTAAASWCIKKTVVSTAGNTKTVTEYYAGASMKYDNVWDNRASLNYGFLI